MTRAALIDAAQRVFSRDGFAAAGTEAISKAARVTRGAFYHHFDGKLDLFDAVVEHLSARAATKVKRRASEFNDPWHMLLAGIDAYLEICLEPDYAKIVVQSAPAVLGEGRYLEIDEAHSGGLLIANMKALKARGELDIDDPVLFGRMTNAMICKLALLLQETGAFKASKAAGLAMVRRFLDAHRV